MNQCAQALQTTVDAQVNRHAEILKSKRAEKEVLPWMSSYRALAETANRLKEAGALTVAPGLTDGIDKLLSDFDKKRNELESEEISKRDTISKQTLVEGPQKCARAKTEIERFTAKVAEHKAGGNEGKVRAYERKLEAAQLRIEELTRRLKAAAELTPFADEKNRALLDAARAAGCAVP